MLKLELEVFVGVTPDQGWVETIINMTTTPIRFTNFSAQRVSTDSVKVTFESEEDNTIQHYIVKISFDGKTYREVAIVLPNGVVGGKTYFVTVKLKQ